MSNNLSPFYSDECGDRNKKKDYDT